MLRSIKKSMTYQLANTIDEHRREDERFSSMFFCFLTSSVEHKKSLSELSFDKEPDKHISGRLCSYRYFYPIMIFSLGYS